MKEWLYGLSLLCIGGRSENAHAALPVAYWPRSLSPSRLINPASHSLPQ